MDYKEFFQKSHSSEVLEPYAYQEQLAGQSLCQSKLISIPTGLGKTAAVIHAWLWNRVHLERKDWPRRLVYCLPMRTLVEQTSQCAKKWLTQHELLWDKKSDHHQKVGLHMLMGGEEKTAWDLYPEEDAILIGTQDMLLSRALNRGYGINRFRWPMHYGLLNSDCLWVFDEVQLMGAGLPTTAQLEAFRRMFGTEKNCHSWWMSATSKADWLKTVDFAPADLGETLILPKADLEDERVIQLRSARKTLARCAQPNSEHKKLASEILGILKEREGLALIIVNTVKQAKALHTIIDGLQKKSNQPRPILLHSQFRPKDRARQLKDILEHARQLEDIPKAKGIKQIVISTQIVEAGVDLSAATLFTELAPWSSLVQRFGRCNRRGKEKDARVYIIGTAKALPYEEEQLSAANAILDAILAGEANVSPENLQAIPLPACDRPVSRHVIRRRDFLDLFDTTPDLSGQDIDIDRWVREIEDTGVQLFWRDWDGAGQDKAPPEKDFPAPQPEELCAAPLNRELKDWVKKPGFVLRRWDHLAGKWEKVGKEFGEYVLIPGQVYLVPAKAGGYSRLG